ncbi:MAG: late competence development ComFB family protein [Brevinematia bacterium]
MQDLKNVVEDIVIEQIEKLENDLNEKLDVNQKKEVAAYVLNRVKPMYITSNKGFTNLISTYRSDPQFITDIILKINEAFKIIKKSSLQLSKIELEREKLYYVFPKIYGRVISSKKLTPLESAVVSLYINEVLVESLFQLWRNPTEILPIDNGIFSFAPKPILASPPYEKRNFVLKINIQSGEGNYEKVFFLNLKPSPLTNIKTDFHENVLQVEDIYVPF